MPAIRHFSLLTEVAILVPNVIHGNAVSKLISQP